MQLTKKQLIKYLSDQYDLTLASTKRLLEALQRWFKMAWATVTIHPGYRQIECAG